jgi:fatty-acyl-CoA synthase
MHAFHIASEEDLRRIEAQPYAAFMAHSSVFSALGAAAAQHPQRRALSYIQSAAHEDKHLSWTYEAFIADVRRAANLFRELAGDAEARVAMLLPAIPQAYFTLWGAETAGTICPINYLLSEAHIGELIRASGASILVALGPNPDLDIWSKVPGLRQSCPNLLHVLAVGGAPGALDFEAVHRAKRGNSLTFDPGIAAGTRAALFHTGGTTGAPKLAQHTHGNQLHASWGAAQMYAMTSDDVIINGFPLFHVAGSFVFGLSALLSGAEVLLPTLLGMRNAEFVRRYWEVVQRHRVTLLAAVPTVISTLLGTPCGSADIGVVRALLTGGSPLPPELATAFEDSFGIPVRNILGMTECAGVISIEPFHAPRIPGSCGLRLPYTSVVASPEGAAAQPCPPGQSGILRVRGPNVGPGYTDARRNAATFSDDGWLTTGDIGHIGEDGRIYITGRAKDVIIRSGHNIEPGVIEDALMRHEDVEFAAAVGEPDEYAGEIPVAFVVLKPGSNLDMLQLVEFAARHIPERPAVPKRIDVLSSLPLTAVGKVYKPALRLRAIERVITDRLRAHPIGWQARAQGREISSGLFVAFSCDEEPPPGDLQKAVKALMSPFAIPWGWETASLEVSSSRS